MESMVAALELGPDSGISEKVRHSMQRLCDVCLNASAKKVSASPIGVVHLQHMTNLN